MHLLIVEDEKKIAAFLRRGLTESGFVVDLGRKVNPIVTPDEPDAFEAVLRDRANLGAGNARRMKGPFI